MPWRVSLTILIFLCLSNSTLAEPVSLTIDEAISIALRENRDVLLKDEEVKKAKLEIAESNAGLFPTLNFTGSQTYTRGYYAKDIKQTTTQATLKQYLYKGGETINTIKYNGYKFEVAQAVLDKTKIELVLDVKKSFYTLLLAGEYVRLNENIVKNAQAHLDFIKVRYRNGQASESEILDLETSLATVKDAFETSCTQADSASGLLNNLLYLTQDTKIEPSGIFDYRPLEVAYEEAFLKALLARPEIRQYESQMKADQANIEVAKADTRPSIYASWDYYSRSNTSLTFSPSKGWQDNNVVGLTFSWPIFDGWATKAKVEQAIVDLKSTQLLKEKAIGDIALELKNAYLSLKDAISEIKTTQAQLRLYKDELANTKERHKQGMVSFLDLDDANLKYEVSVFKTQQAIYDYIIAKSSFDKATGGI